MSLVTFVSAPGFTGVHGVLNQGNGISYDVGAAMAAGGGAIVVDSVGNPFLYDALLHYPGVMVQGSSPGSQPNIDSIATVLAHSIRSGGAASQIGDVLAKTSDGLYAPSPSAGGGVPADVVTADVVEPTLGSAYTLSFSSQVNKLYIVVATVTADCTITLTNRAAGCRAVMYLTQDATGNHAVSLSDGVTPQSAGVNPAAASTSKVEVTCPDSSAIFVDTEGGPVVTVSQAIALSIALGS